MIPAVIYARYSSTSQREESIAGQLRDCYAFADRNGYKVIDEYTDSAMTATSFGSWIVLPVIGMTRLCTAND